MKVLLAVDGSRYSDAAIREVANRHWPEGTEIKVLAVAHAAIPMIPDPTMTGLAMHEESLAVAIEHAQALVAKISAELAKVDGATVSTAVVEGSPRHVVVQEADDWGADLLVVGSHGRSTAGRMLLGSVSHAAALHAHCSVQIVRSRPPEGGDCE